MKLIEVRLIDLNSALAVEDPVDDLASLARDFGGRTTIVIAEHITR